MCESQTIFYLCGHVKLKTIVQCAETIERLIKSGLSIASTRQVCEDNVIDNVHIFPSICDKCKATGVIGEVMEIPGMKVEVLRAWRAAKGKSSLPTMSGALAGDDQPVKGDDDNSDEIKELGTSEPIAPDGDARASTSASMSTARFSSPISHTSSKTSHGTPDLSQIKTRVAALRCRTQRLLTRTRILTKIRAHKTPTIGES